MVDFEELTITGKTEFDSVDRCILQAWATVLQCDRIHMQDMFFECGGNSLLAGEFFNLLQAEYPCLTVVDLYAYSTPEGIGECIRKKLDTADHTLETIDDDRDLEDLVARYMSGELAMDELSALLEE